MKNLHLSTLLTLVLLLGVIQLKAITQEWNFSAQYFSSLGEVNYELNLDGLKVYATSDKPVVFDESTASADGKDFTARLKLSGAGSTIDPQYRVVSFYVPQNAEIKVVCTSSSDIGTRELLLVSPAGDTIHTFQAPGGSINVETYNYTAGAGYVKLLSKSSGINLYYISATSELDHKVTLFDPATCNPANLPAGMTIVEEGGVHYMKAALDAWNSSFYFDPFYIENEVTHLVFEAKYKIGTSGYAINELNSLFKFIEPNWSEVTNLQFPASTEFMEYRLPVFSGSGLWCSGMLIAGRELLSGNGNAISGDTIFIGRITAYIDDPNVIFNPANYDNSTLPAGMSIVEHEGEKLLQVVTNEWESVLYIPRFEITTGHTARCNHKYLMGSATADTLSSNQVQSMIVLIDNENTIPNPWGEGEIQARLTLQHNPAPNEMSLISGEFTNDMQYVHVVQFAGQQNVSWEPTIGDTIWVSKIEHIYIVPPPPSHIEVLKTTIAPMLDGVEEQCWNGVEAVPLAQNFVGEDPTVNAYWKAMWADSGLFVLVNVQDDNHYPAWEAGSFETWTYDLSEVALDVNAVLDDGLGSRDNQGHYQHSGVFQEELYGSPIINELFTYANQLSGENRISEYYIPFSEMQNKNGNFLNKDSLLLLDAIGFDVCVTDQDQGITDRRHRKVWQNTGLTDENWANMNDAGSIQLIDAPVRLSDSVLVTFRVDMR
ncbi:MAG: hypothetical protein JW735_05505, partial [Prolixibacteraceae bacterium]|nr:hypothetical protein [Prolixibacteraceae bacterium]